MKDIYKNPMLYYILVPCMAALWPLLVWAVYLPAAERDFDQEKKEYTKARVTIAAILVRDPTRLELADPNKTADKFDYATSVSDIANRCGIAATNYTVSSKPIRTSSGKKSQSATVVLKQINIASFANFLSKIQLRWANLQCESVTLTQKKGLKDVWKVDLDFKYYF
jgi:cytochrome oxidase assembly protein ShyY1